MSEIYTPSKATFVDQVTVPQDGVDNPTVGSILTSVEAIADNAAFNHDKAFYGIEGYVPVPLGMPLENTSARWSFSATLGAWYQDDDTDAGELWWPVPTPIKGRITEILAEIDGDAGPGGANHTAGGVPGTLPTITLYRVEYSDAGLTQIGTATDAPADAAAYDALHTFGPTGLTEDIIAGRSYLVKITGEAGAGKLPDELLLASIMLKLEAAP